MAERTKALYYGQAADEYQALIEDPGIIITRKNRHGVRTERDRVHFLSYSSTHLFIGLGT